MYIYFSEFFTIRCSMENNVIPFVKDFLINAILKLFSQSLQILLSDAIKDFVLFCLLIKSDCVRSPIF